MVGALVAPFRGGAARGAGLARAPAV